MLHGDGAPVCAAAADVGSGTSADPAPTAIEQLDAAATEATVVATIRARDLVGKLVRVDNCGLVDGLVHSHATLSPF